MSEGNQNSRRTEPHDPYAALRLGEFRAFLFGRNLSGMGDSMQAVVVGWDLYLRTHRADTLGYVGLIQALPIFLFALHAGHIADKFSRKWVSILAQLAYCLCSLTLALLSAIHASLPWFFVCLFCASTARAYGNPARGALLPQVVPRPLLTSAISWDTSLRRIAVMSGAAVGGASLAALHQAWGVYLVTAVAGVVSSLLLLLLPDNTAPASQKLPHTSQSMAAPVPPQQTFPVEGTSHTVPTPAYVTMPASVSKRADWHTLIAGIKYIASTRIILATITLDLFAVLLGGATTLLPIYAHDIM